MPALVARIQRTVPLLLALLVPLAFIACEADGPVTPTDLVSSTADAKGGNGKGGGPGGGGDDGGDGGGDPGTPVPSVRGEELDLGAIPTGPSLAVFHAAGDYLVGVYWDVCGFVHRISTGVTRCILIEDEDGALGFGDTFPLSVNAHGRVVGAYRARDRTEPLFVYDVDAGSSDLSGTLTLPSPPTGWDIVSTDPDARVVDIHGRVLVDVARQDPANPQLETAWTVGLLSADLSTITIEPGTYDFVGLAGLSDAGYAAVTLRGFAGGDRNGYYGATWSGASGESAAVLAGTEGRKAASVQGVFDGSGIYGVDGDRPVYWTGPLASPVSFSDVRLRGLAGHDDAGRLLSVRDAGSKQPGVGTCLTAAGGQTDLLLPDGYSDAYPRSGATGVAYGMATDPSGQPVVMTWDLSGVTGGC